jgi:DNA-binding winged helix-turn-helix (wHTH) protein/TolB-like protein/tetratricopeptide (TPR) repeat protein
MYRFGRFELDGGRRSLRSTEPDRAVALSGKPFDTLLYLVEHRGRLVGKRELLEAVWPSVVVEEANLAQTISVLRRALEDDARAHVYIATIAGRGYQFIAPVEVVASELFGSASAAPTVATPESDTGARSTAEAAHSSRSDARPRVERLSLALLVALAAVVIVIGAGRWVFNGGDEGVRETVARLPNSVAVLPFEDLSPDPGDASLVLGIQQEIIWRLQKIQDLTVIPWSAVRRYADTQAPFPEIAAELRVEAVLHGSIRYADDSVKVEVELIDGQTGALLWTDRHHGDLLDTSDFQSKVASTIADELGAKLLPTERESIATRLTESPAAYSFYLKAVAALNETSYEESLHYLDRAIAQDADFPAAHGLRAMNLACSVITSTRVARASSWEQEAQAAATKALNGDESVSSAWVARAMIHLFHWRWKQAGEAYEKSMVLATKDPNTLQEFAAFNFAIGNHEKAVAVIRQAIAVDPDRAVLHYFLGFVLGLLDRHDEQLAAYRRASELNPTSPLYQRAIGGAELRLQHVREAEKAFRDSEQLMEGYPGREIWLPGLAYDYAMVDMDDDAVRLAKEYLSAENRSGGSGDRALAYLALREQGKEQALAELTAAVAKIEAEDIDAGWWGLVSIKYNYLGDPMLDEPQFRDLRERIRGR